ncbi:unnamed protein product [Rotaria socialis]|uniref:Uncharacterized protein n=2 Tax=Rotaria socialis TaxID=392032 RepID=A0A820F3H5_9BILA|nr:unnamed protein product [Rotaria socialis]CAF3443663.1 unnamed protein product [Rotaria socialis]CAF3453678.1 unnamed protein product [Rotaria socialis]CAF3610150.1 unnamed protein product [Rotaria socialis]CAF3760019.1 unnamed protein product [Rotaria socialis]
MTTFARPSLLDNRYSDIAETSVFTYDDDDLVNYADFLRKHGRYMTKGGYVDSSRRVRSLHRQQDDSILSQHPTAPSRGGLLAAINKSQISSASAPPITTQKKVKQPTGNELPSVIAISKSLENKKKEYDKQMRLIEEQMIKSKQTEREGKRVEGDVKKEQRHLHHTLKELDIDATKKHFEAEKSLSKNLEEKDRIERDFAKKKEQYSETPSQKSSNFFPNINESTQLGECLVKSDFNRQTKLRTDHTIIALQTSKEKDRHNIIVCNDLARKYRTKASELESKHQQLTQLHSDFEHKVHQKELEENRVKKELGEIAMALNLEAQKAQSDMSQFVNIMSRDRTQTIKHDLHEQQKFEERLNQTSIHVKNYDLERRRLSADATLHRSMLDLKQREALRRIVDTKNRLEVIYTKQRELNQNAAIAEQDRRAAELMMKMADIENRRTNLMNHYLREKTEKSEEREIIGSTKAKVRYAEHETQLHEDHLRHFQKTVVKNEEVEHDLRKSVKEADFERRKKEQEVQRLQEEIVRKKRLDAIRIREEISKAEHDEQELEQQFIKEKSKLDKLHTQCEDNYFRLLKQREQIRENKMLLQIHEREHERLLRVNARSKSLQSLNNI